MIYLHLQFYRNAPDYIGGTGGRGGGLGKAWVAVGSVMVIGQPSIHASVAQRHGTLLQGHCSMLQCN